jgi:hypothetical protein
MLEISRSTKNHRKQNFSQPLRHEDRRDRRLMAEEERRRRRHRL